MICLYSDKNLFDNGSICLNQLYKMRSKKNKYRSSLKQAELKKKFSSCLKISSNKLENIWIWYIFIILIIFIDQNEITR